MVKLRQKLQAASCECDARQRQIADTDSSIERTASRLAVLRAEREAAINRHGDLRSEASDARQQLESRINSLKVARAAAHAAQHRGSQGRASQWTKVNGTARSIETLAEEARKKDEQVAAARQVLVELRQGLEEQRAALATLKVANGALVESARETASKHNQAASSLASAIEQRRLQNESGAAGLRAAETALRDLQAKCEEKRRQETQALQAAYRRQVEEMQEVEASLWAVRSRLDAASLELEEEQGHNLRLGEVIASEAAACGYEGPSHARKAITIATARDRSPRASKPGIPGPSNDAWAGAKERWEQELAGLRRWKDEAAGAVQRMADGLRALRQRYDEQFRVGADLQASLDRLGQRQRQAFGDTAALPPSEPLTTSWWESKEGNLVSDDWSFWPKMPKTLKARPAGKAASASSKEATSRPPRRKGSSGNARTRRVQAKLLS